jgi:hypothetical protein
VGKRNRDAVREFEAQEAARTGVRPLTFREAEEASQRIHLSGGPRLGAADIASLLSTPRVPWRPRDPDTEPRP